MDINIQQQRTPRFWKTKTENEKTIRDLVNNVDSNENLVITYNDIDLDDTTIVMEPAPYVSGEINQEKDKLYNEFLRLIGIANLSYQKKERNISDEIQAMQGGTIASRYSRFEPRQKAVKLINEKFGEKIEVKYYDGIPSTEKELDDFLDSNESILDNGGDE